MSEFQKWLIPREGLVVRDPRTKAPLPPEGMLKDWIGPEGRYWRRRIKVGDVIIGEPPRSKKAEEVVKEKRRK